MTATDRRLTDPPAPYSAPEQPHQTVITSEHACHMRNPQCTRCGGTHDLHDCLTPILPEDRDGGLYDKGMVNAALGVGYTLGARDTVTRAEHERLVAAAREEGRQQYRSLLQSARNRLVWLHGRVHTSKPDSDSPTLPIIDNNHILDRIDAVLTQTDAAPNCTNDDAFDALIDSPKSQEALGTMAEQVRADVANGRTTPMDDKRILEDLHDGLIAQVCDYGEAMRKAIDMLGHCDASYILLDAISKHTGQGERFDAAMKARATDLTTALITADVEWLEAAVTDAELDDAMSLLYQRAILGDANACDDYSRLSNIKIDRANAARLSAEVKAATQPEAPNNLMVRADQWQRLHDAIKRNDGFAIMAICLEIEQSNTPIVRAMDDQPRNIATLRTELSRHVSNAADVAREIDAIERAGDYVPVRMDEGR